jgi:alkylation response protein AidB-like acyl-CoA dehydrogenase
VSAPALRERVSALRRSGELDLATPGTGATAARLERLATLGHEDLSVARLAEPHVDARAIAEDLGVTLSVDGLYGVWASGGRASTMTVHRSGGGWCLSGQKPFCSGAEICDGALVTVACRDGGSDVLIDLDLVAARRSGRLEVDPTGWSTVAFEDTCTATAIAHDIELRADAVVAPAEAYLVRPGFWHGALGPAAVWVGGIRGLVGAAADVVGVDADAHDRAALGRLRALEWATSAWLGAAGDEVDADPADLCAARRRGVTVRHLVQRAAIEAIDLFGQLGGPRSLAFDRDAVRRVQELQLYVRQFHGPVELELLGAPDPDHEATTP